MGTPDLRPFFSASLVAFAFARALVITPRSSTFVVRSASALFVARSAYDPLDPSWFWAAGQHTSTPLNVVGAAGSAVLVVGLCLWLCRSARGARLVSPLRAAGSMTLTLYVMHVVMTWANRELDASFTTGYYREWWIQVVLLVTLAWLWRLITPRGPLETLVRWCSLARPHLPHRPRATRRT